MTAVDVSLLHDKAREALLAGRLPNRPLHPGDYLRSEPGTTDHRVWSETGCTCVLLTSTRDVLR